MLSLIHPLEKNRSQAGIPSNTWNHWNQKTSLHIATMLFHPRSRLKKTGCIHNTSGYPSCETAHPWSIAPLEKKGNRFQSQNSECWYPKTHLKPLPFQQFEKVGHVDSVPWGSVFTINQLWHQGSHAQAFCSPSSGSKVRPLHFDPSRQFGHPYQGEARGRTRWTVNIVA